MRVNSQSNRSLSSYHGAAGVLKADGSVTFLDQSMTADYLRQLLVQ
jgi:hypothetical protein